MRGRDGNGARMGSECGRNESSNGERKGTRNGLGGREQEELWRGEDGTATSGLEGDREGTGGNYKRRNETGMGGPLSNWKWTNIG